MVNSSYLPNKLDITTSNLKIDFFCWIEWSIKWLIFKLTYNIIVSQFIFNVFISGNMLSVGFGGLSDENNINSSVLYFSRRPIEKPKTTHNNNINFLFQVIVLSVVDYWKKSISHNRYPKVSWKKLDITSVTTGFKAIKAVAYIVHIYHPARQPAVKPERQTHAEISWHKLVNFLQKQRQNAKNTKPFYRES